MKVWSWTLVVTAVVAGCAVTPAPDAQIARATQTLQQARHAQAAEFAALEMRLAEDKLMRAQALVQTGDPDRYREAEHLAEQAEIDAQVAMARAELAKVRQEETELQRRLEQLEEPAGTRRSR